MICVSARERGGCPELSGALTPSSGGLNPPLCVLPGITYLWGRNVCLNRDFNMLWLARV